jgi:nucleotide-binding universal stress UspA family protein
MTRVVVPVRYPLTGPSVATLEEAVSLAREHDADMTVLHVDLYQDPRGVTRADLKRAAERAVGRVDRARYVVRRGFLVEETILEEVAAEQADIVVIGSQQASSWRKMVKRFLDDPDIETFLEEKLDCQVVTVRAE